MFSKILVFLIFSIISKLRSEDNLISYNVYYIPGIAEKEENTTISVFKEAQSVTLDKNCNIKKLSKEMFNITHTVFNFYVAGCDLIEIESNFLHDQNVSTKIMIRDTKITKLKTHTFVDSEVEIIFLDHNSIEIIEEKAFVNMTNLAQIFLNMNCITRLNRESFHNLPRLAAFRMQYNQLKTLEKSCLSFIKVDNAKVMLDHNEIVELHDGILDDLQVEKLFLYLAYNFIETLPTNIFDNRSLDTVDLSNNKITVIADICKRCIISHLLVYDNPLNVTHYDKILEFGKLNDIDITGLDFGKNNSHGFYTRKFVIVLILCLLLAPQTL
ncbi:Leucine-rich repeat-containing protein 7-like Protein [Tribolium castaneum]|uniref:Leucine-rich repeat-containing protein 7-like Protein n=1 Tax=Tribolium castaneum TaxID=7070 RepID=D6WUJ5_TRICA|nr:Leucine-rich repeat-containing protein 7-like Protein [Tribolium castaneum]